MHALKTNPKLNAIATLQICKAMHTNLKKNTTKFIIHKPMLVLTTSKINKE